MYLVDPTRIFFSHSCDRKFSPGKTVACAKYQPNDDFRDSNQVIAFGAKS